MPGLGPVWTAGLVAEIGDIAQYAGLVWKARESGKFQAENTALNKAGNRYLRCYLIEAANYRGSRRSLGAPLRMRVHCPEYTAYYQAKMAQSSKHGHKRALVLTARKLRHLVDTLLRTNTLYQPPEHR